MLKLPKSLNKPLSQQYGNLPQKSAAQGSVVKSRKMSSLDLTQKQKTRAK
jgi:hypothetical protein